MLTIGRGGDAMLGNIVNPGNTANTCNAGHAVLTGVVVACGILVLCSLLGLNVPPPAAWLEAWTKWIATVVAIVVSARVLWSGATLLRKLSGG